MATTGVLVATYDDRYGRATRTEVGVTGTDTANLEANAATILAAQAACTQMQNVKASITLDVPPVAGAPSATSDYTVDAKCRGPSVKDGKTILIRIPNPLEAMIESGGSLNLADINLAAYLALFVDAGIGTISDGDQVVGWNSGAMVGR